MVDPRIYDNPYRAPDAGTISRDVHRENLQHAHAGLIPKGTIPEVMPSDGRLVKLMPCLRCKQQKVPYVFSPRTKVWTSNCLNCGQAHVFHPKGLELSSVQGDRRVERIGPKRDYHGTPYIDATRGFDDLRRKRELGPAYWRNPK